MLSHDEVEGVAEPGLVGNSLFRSFESLLPLPQGCGGDGGGSGAPRWTSREPSWTWAWVLLRPWYQLGCWLVE